MPNAQLYYSSRPRRARTLLDNGVGSLNMYEYKFDTAHEFGCDGDRQKRMTDRDRDRDRIRISRYTLR